MLEIGTISSRPLGMIRLAIVGCRDYTNYDNFKTIVDQYINEIGYPSEIVSGGCRGVDKPAETYANNLNIPTKIFEADWAKYGKGAGPLRNDQMVEYCTHVLALPSKNSVGTLNTIAKAKNKARILKVVNI